jgi:hypothetical protein
MALARNYRAICLETKNRQGIFDGQRVDSCQVIGKGVEVCLKLAYRPAVGLIPVPLPLQTSSLVPSVHLHDIFVPGHSKASPSLLVKVFPSDAQKAIDISQDVVQKLMGPPWHLQVLSVDHTGAAGGTSHDILMSPTSWHGLKSSLPNGVYSVELKCRTIVDPKSFDWLGVLTKEATPLLEKEVAKSPGSLKGRILVLVQMQKQCTTGSHALHGCILMSTPKAEWEQMWGWVGFQKLPSVPQAPRAISPQASQASPRAPWPARSPRNPEASFKAWLKTVGANLDDDWLLLATFLRYVKEPAEQAKRYVDGTSKRTWKIGAGRGRLPKTKVDWEHRKMARGGGAGKGGLHGKVTFLKQVFLKYYKHRV